MTWGKEPPVLVTTTSFVPGREIESVLGLVSGAEKLGRGGTSNVEEKTAEAIERLTSAARNIEADAVIDLRFKPIQPTSDSADTNYSMFWYGTAVKLKDEMDP